MNALNGVSFLIHSPVTDLINKCSSTVNVQICPNCSADYLPVDKLKRIDKKIKLLVQIQQVIKVLFSK
jgi:hypothetical protein